MSFNISSDPVGFWVTGLSCVSAFIASALQKISDQILPFEMFDKTIPTNFLLPNASETNPNIEIRDKL